MEDFSPKSDDIDAEIDEILGTKSKKPAKIASPKTVSNDIDVEIDGVLGDFSGSDPVGKTVSRSSVKTARKRTSSPYDHLIEDSAQRHGVDPDLIRRQMGTESSFNPNAKSHKNAMGLMQLIPGTARRMGVTNIYDPKQNIEGGVKYMRQLLDMFGGDVNLALAGYNAGEGAVKKYGNKVPPYAETRKYVKQIGSGYTGNGYLQTKAPKGGNQSAPRDVDPITSIDDEIDSLLAGIPQAPEVPDGSVYNKPADTPTGLPDNSGSATGTPNEIFQSRTSNLENPVNVDALTEAMNVASDQSKLADIAQAAKQGINYTKEVEPVQVETQEKVMPKTVATGKPSKAPVSGSVTTDVDPNDPGVQAALAEQAKQLAEYGSEADDEVGNQLRRKAGLSPIDRPREFGKPNENLDGIAITYQTSPDESEEDAFRSAYIAAGANPSQVEAKIRKLKALGKPLFATGYHPGNKIGVSYGDLEDIGVEDVITNMRMEQAQSRPGLVTPKDIHVGRDFIKDDAEWLNENAGDYVGAINPLLNLLPKGLKDALGAGIASGFLGSGSRMSDAVGGAMRYNPLFDIAKPITGDLPSAMREMAKSGHGLEEKTGDDSFQSQLFKTIGGAPGDLSRLYLVTRLPGGIITGMAMDAGLQSAGRGESKSQTATQMAKGAIIGTIFRGAGFLGKFAKSTAGDSKVAQQVFEKGIAGSAILGGTYETEKAFGTPQKKAEHAALINTLFYLTAAGYDMRGKTARVRTADNRTLNGFVDAQGNIRLLKGRIEKPDVEARAEKGFEERFNKDQQNREDISKSQKEGEAKLNNEIYKRQQAEKVAEEKGLPEAPPKRVENPTPEAVTKATNHPVAQRVSTILADGKPRTLDAIARESKLKNADKISEAIDTLYSAGQIQINPDGTVQINGGERPDTSLYDQFDASGRVKPTTVPTTPVAPVANTQDDDEDLPFTPASTLKQVDTKEYPPSGLDALTEADIRRERFEHPQRHLTDTAAELGISLDQAREIAPTLPLYTDEEIAKKFGVSEEQVAGLRPLGEIGSKGALAHRIRRTIISEGNEPIFNALSDAFAGGELRFKDAPYEGKARMAAAVLDKMAQLVGKPRSSQMTMQDWTKALEHPSTVGKLTLDQRIKINTALAEGAEWNKKFDELVASPRMTTLVRQAMTEFGAVVNADGTIEFQKGPLTWEDLLELDDTELGRGEEDARSGGATLAVRKLVLALGKEIGGLKENGKPLFTREAIHRAYNTAVYARTGTPPQSRTDTRQVATAGTASSQKPATRGKAAASSTQKVAPIKVVKKPEPKAETKVEPKKAPVVAEKVETREEDAPEPKKATEVKEKPKKPTLEGTKEEIKKEKAPVERLHSVPVTAKGQPTSDAQVFIEADIDPTVKLTPNKTSSVWRVKSPDGIEVKGATYKEALELAQRIADGLESGTFFSRAWQGSPVPFNQEILVKDKDGNESYIEGTPHEMPKVPKGYSLVRELPLGRHRDDKLLSGTGGMIQGHGHYFADAEGVARYYKDLPSRHQGQDITYKGAVIKSWDAKSFPLGQALAFMEEGTSPAEAIHAVKTQLDRDLAGANNSLNRAMQKLKDLKPRKLEALEGRYKGKYVVQDDWTWQRAHTKAEAQARVKDLYDRERKGLETEVDGERQELQMFSDWAAEVAALDPKDFRPEHGGALYKVDLKPEQDEYLLWDRPMSDQSEKVKKAIDNAAQEATKLRDERNDLIIKAIAERGSYPNELGGADKLGAYLSSIKLGVHASRDKGSQFYKTISSALGGDRAASEYLRSIGIRGNKYLDANSRGASPVATVLYQGKDLRGDSKTIEEAPDHLLEIDREIRQGVSPEQAIERAKLKTRGELEYAADNRRILERSGLGSEFETNWHNESLKKLAAIKKLKPTDFRVVENKLTYNYVVFDPKDVEVEERFFSRPNVSTTAVLSQIKPYTTTVLTKLKQFQGRDVKIQTVRETLKQGGIKAQDKKMIERILNRPEFKDANSIPYDELDKAIRLEVMPLQVIETQTYADYGKQNVGVSADSTKTYIFNSPVSHGYKGHFGGDFDDGIDVWDIREVKDRETGEITYLAVPEGPSFQGTTEAEAMSFVGTASSDRNTVEKWVKERGGIRSTTNEGLYGHSRIWRVGKDSNMAEGQSDTYQKQNLERMLIESYLNDYRNNKLKIGDVSPELYTTVKQLSNTIARKSRLWGRVNIRISVNEVRDADIASINRANVAKYAEAMLDSLTNETAPVEVLEAWAKTDPSKDIHSHLTNTAYDEWSNQIQLAAKIKRGKPPRESIDYLWRNFGNNVEGDVGDEPTKWEIAQNAVNQEREFADITQRTAVRTTENVRLNVPEYMTYERLVEDEKDLMKDVIKYFTSTDEQFIAHKKNYIARILRETIRIEALADQERFLIPTALTAARIEGFVAAKRARGTFGDPNGPYGVNNGVYEVENAQGNEETLVQGDTIRMGNDLYHVVEATDDTIDVINDNEVYSYTYWDFAEAEANNEWDSMSYAGHRRDGAYMTPKGLEDFIRDELYLHDIDSDDFPEYFATEYENPDYTKDGDEEETIWADAGEDLAYGDPIGFNFEWDSRKFQDAISNELSNREYDLGEYLTNYRHSWALPRGDGYYYTDEPAETFDQPWVIREREEEAQRRENELNIGYHGQTVQEMEGMWGDLDDNPNPVWEARTKVAVAMQRGYGFADAAQVVIESVKGDIDLDPDDAIIVRHAKDMLAELNRLKAEDFATVEVEEAPPEIKKLGRDAIEQPVMKDFSDERQTILKKYIELESLFFDERDDVEVVEDAGGNQWLASPLTEADKGDVVVFNKAKETLDAENDYVTKTLSQDFGGWEGVGRGARARFDGDVVWLSPEANRIVENVFQTGSIWTGVYNTISGTTALYKGLANFHTAAQENGDIQLAKGIERVFEGVVSGIDDVYGDVILYTELPDAPDTMEYGVQEERLHRADLRLRKVASWRNIFVYEENPAYNQAARALSEGAYAGADHVTIHHEIVAKMFRDDAEIELGLTYNQLQSIRLLHYDQLIANGVTDAEIEKAYQNISKNASEWIATQRSQAVKSDARGVNSTRGSPNAPQFSRLQGIGNGRGKGVDKALEPYPFARDVAQNVGEKGQRVPQALFSKPTNVAGDAFPDIEGIPESELTMEAHRTRIEKVLGDVLPNFIYDGRREVTPAEAIGNTVRAGYLLGVSVVLTNVQGNPLNQVVEQGVKVFSGPLDWLNSKINPKSGYERHNPGLSLLDIAEGMFGKEGALRKAVLSTGKGSIYEVLRKGVGDEEREKFDLLPLVHSSESKKGRWDENVVRNTGIPAWDLAIEASVRISSALDRPFKAFKNASEIRGLARLTATKLRKQGAITKTQYYDFVKQLNKDPNAWMEAVAKRSAQIDTFQNPNAITDEINKIKKKLLTGRFASDVQDVQARQDAAKLVGQLLYLVMTSTAPFLNTPANIGIRALEYTPVGLALGAVRYAKIGKTLERLEWAEKTAERRKKEDARIAKERLQENRDIKSILDKYSAQKKAKKAERDQAIADIESSTVMTDEFKKARIKKAKENYKTWEAGWTEAKTKRAQAVDSKLADAGTERAKIDAGIAADRAREDAEANRKFTALENNAFTSGLGRTAFGATFGSLFFLGVFMGILKAVGYVNYDDDQQEWEKRRDAGIPDASIGVLGYRFPYDNSPLGKALAIGVTAMEQAQRGGSVEKRAEGSAKGVVKGLRNLFPYTENRFDTQDEWLEIGKTIKSVTPFVNMKILEEAANIIDDKPRTTFKQGMTAPFRMTFAREGIPMLGIDPLPVTKHPMGKRHDSMLWRGLQTINPMRSIKQVKEKNWAPSPHKK